MKLKDICKHIGLNCEDKSDIEGINQLDLASENEISFFHNKKYAHLLNATKAKAVLIEKEYAKKLPKNCKALIVDEPYLMMAKLSWLFAKPLVRDGSEPKIGKNCTIEQGVFIGKDSSIGENCTILSGAYIGHNVKIGNNCTIYPSVTIYNDSTIGNNCILHAGVKVGVDGFGYAHTKDGKHIKIFHKGTVVIEDDVEIGANSCIDRAVFGQTVIKKGVKIDNLVQIGHNCKIGEYSIIVSQVGLSGSTKLGRNVVMGGQSASAGHLSIGDFATVAARGAIIKSVEGGKIYSGVPHREHKDWLKLQAIFTKILKKGVVYEQK